VVSRKFKQKSLILAIILSFFLSYASISLYNSQQINDIKNRTQIKPEISLPALPGWAISQNATEIYRLFEAINFTINTFDFSDANYTKMKISFTNGSIREYDMEFIGSNLFLGIYKPEYNAPLGMQNVSFLIYNETNQLLNSQTTFRNFTINTNYLVNLYNSENLQTSEYFINDTLSSEILVINFKSYDFSWNTTIVNTLNELTQENTIIFERNIIQFNLLLKNETFNKNQFYYVQLNMTDKNSGKEKTAYFPFYVRNNKPTFSSPLFLSPNEVFRTEDFTISFNATDIETKSEDLTPWIYIYDSEGSQVIKDIVEFDSNDLFSENFNIPANRPIGQYRVNVTINDKNYESSSTNTMLIVKNNLPEIHSYKINGLSMDQPISIFYGRDLVFSFNVSDIEGVSYVKVALINENNEWFNITRTYSGENNEITIRTVDLIEGIWYVYIYVIDTDGAVVSLIDDYDKAPQGIRIVPDIVGFYLPWILFFGALIFGLFLGILVSFSYFKSKREPQKTRPKKKKVPIKKPIARKKEKAKPIKEEPEEKKIEELKTEQEKEKEEMPQRKIKRKL
jgi:hypothetical protein